jgi:hypothetical protein
MTDFSAPRDRFPAIPPAPTHIEGLEPRAYTPITRQTAEGPDETAGKDYVSEFVRQRPSARSAESAPTPEEEPVNPPAVPLSEAVTIDYPGSKKGVIAASSPVPPEKRSVVDRIPEKETPESVSSPEDPASPSAPTIETHVIDGQQVTVNKTHTDQGLVDLFLDELPGNGIAENWWKVNPYKDEETSKGFYVDSRGDPVFFCKEYPYPNLQSDPTKEIRQAERIRDAVSSEAAQQLAREHGFAGISYVEPLAAVEDASGAYMVVYPMQQGEVLEGADDLVSDTSSPELVALDAMVDKLGSELRAQGVDPNDMHAGQFLVRSPIGTLLTTVSLLTNMVFLCQLVVEKFSSPCRL